MQPLAVSANYKRRRRLDRLTGIALVLPLLLFLAAVFVAPIAMMLFNSVHSPEIVEALPRTAAAVAGWDYGEAPPEALYVALAADLEAKPEPRLMARAARRLNQEISGYRTLLFRTSRKLSRAEPIAPRDGLVAIDRRWADPAYWRAMQRAAGRYTPFYLLTAVDRRLADDGGIVHAPPEKSIYVGILGRTLWISLVVTFVCLVLSYPVAHQLATLPTRWSNVLMVFVLLPFWTSLLVRISAWVILLQERGVVNDLLLWLQIVNEPLELIYNRTGIYITMVHVMLPFMVLPLFSVMKSIPREYMRAATGLGASPIRAFLRVYLPLTKPGVWSGCLLCFIVSIGYYILPALVGGPADQMIAYFIAFNTNATINWGLASALGVILLACVGLLFGVYSRVAGETRLSTR